MSLLKRLRGRQGVGMFALAILLPLAVAVHWWDNRDEQTPVSTHPSAKGLPTPDGLLGQVQAVDVSRDGRTFACISDQGMILVWDALHWRVKKAWLNRLGDLGVLALSPDGKMVVTEDVSGAGILQFWNAADGKLLWTIPATDQPQRMAFSPNSQRLAIEGGDGTLAVWEVAKPPRQIWRLPGLTSGMQGSHAAVFSHDGALLASTGGPAGVGKAAIWNARTGKSLRIFEDRYDTFGHIALSPDNKLLATEGENAEWIRHWTPPTQGPLTEATTAHSLVVNIWDVRTGRMRRTFPGGWNTSGGTYAMYFTHAGRQLICCYEDTIDIWNVASGKRLRHYDRWAKPETIPVGPSALFPDEQRLIGRNGKADSLCVWDLRTGKVIRRITRWG